MGRQALLPRQWPLGLLVLFLLALTAYLAYPYYLLSRGTAQLEAALAATDDTARLATAIASLEQAHAWRREDALTLRRLAQAYVAARRPADAVAALETARRAEPSSLLVSAELSDVYLAAGQLEEAAALLSRQGVTADMAEQLADKALTQGDGAEAGRWLLRAQALAPDRTAALGFRRAAAALLARASASEITRLAAQANLTIYPLDKPARIPASELRWLADMRQYGVYFGDRTLIGAPPGTGVLWWGWRTMVAVDAPRAGLYSVRLRALQDKPAPIMLNVQVGGQQAIDASLTAADRSWAVLEGVVELQPGPQAIVVSFLNDGSAEGMDRNATLEWLELTPVQP